MKNKIFALIIIGIACINMIYAETVKTTIDVNKIIITDKDKGNIKLTLKYHDYNCFMNCYSIIEIETDKDIIPIDELIFYDDKGSKLNKDYIIKIKDKNESIKDIKTEKDTLKKGNYTIEINTKKSPNEKIDWVLRIGTQEINEWAWYNTTWKNYAEILVQENNNKGLYWYSIKMNVSYLSGMEQNFKDIRFSNGTDELNYWIEENYTSSSAIIWVKIPYLTANSNNSIKMYYNSTVTTTVSDINKTFILGDDFNDNSLDTTRWSTNGTAYSEDGRMCASPSSGLKEMISKQMFPINTELYGKVEYTYDGANNGVLGFGYSKFDGLDIANGTEALVSTNWNNLSSKFISISSSTKTINDSLLGQDYKRLRISRNGTNGVERNYENETGYVNSANVPSGNDLRVGISGYSGTDASICLDWIFVRNYTTIEPTYWINTTTNPIKNIINLTFSESTNATISGYNWINVNNIIIEGGDLPLGENVIVYGNNQLFGFNNDRVTDVTQELYVLNSTSQSQKIYVYSGGIYLKDVWVKVYKLVSGQEKLIGSGVTDGNGLTSIRIEGDSTYKFEPIKTGYYGGILNGRFIDTGATDNILLVMSSNLSYSSFNQFYSNCGINERKNKTCYFYIKTPKNSGYSNLTMKVINNSGELTNYYCWIAETTDEYTCKSPSFALNNNTLRYNVTFYIDSNLINTTLRYVSYKDLTSKPIQITLPVDLLKQAGNEEYLYMFYIVSLIVGIYIALTIEKRVEGYGIITLWLWYTLLTIGGFHEFIVILVPMAIIGIINIFKPFIK